MGIKKAAAPTIVSCFLDYLNHTAGDRNRTGTGGKSRRILSPVRLPVPPRRHPKYRLDHWLVEWTEVDSNHRSKMQQIYSLSPLASRESVHVEVSLTSIYDNIANYKTQAFFKLS